VFADFFGVPAATVTALGRIAHMTHAVIIPCIVYEAGWGRYDIELRAPLELPAKADDVENTAKMNALIEAAVRHRPEQYLWIHRRFKTRPRGERSLYD
jgi:KDO2-lipid IV(A) lauroyltransferase